MEKWSKIGKRAASLAVRTALVAPLLAVLATVLVVDTGLANGVAAGKYAWFHVAMGLTAVTIPLHVAFRRERVTCSLVDLLVVAFCLCGVVVTWCRCGAITHRAVLLLLAGAAYFYFKMASGRWEVYLLVTLFIFTGFVEAALGSRQLYGFLPSQHAGFRTTGSFANPGPYGGYLAMILPVALYYLLRDYRAWQRAFRWRLLPFHARWIVSLVTVVSILLVLPATMSRTAWVAAIAGCSFAGAGYHFRGRRSRDLRAWARRHKKRIAWLGITTIVAGSLALAGAYHLKRDSADGRVLTWKMAARAAWHHPSGVGMGRFAAAYGEEQAAYFAAGKGSERERHVAGNPEYAFNEFLQVAIEMGVIPLLLFAGITVLVIARAVRRRGYPLAGAFVSVQLFACASYPYNLLPFVVALAFLAAGGACGESSRGRGRGRAGWWVVPLLLAGVTGACLYLAWPQRAAYEAWNDARILGSGKLYEKAIEEYEKLSPVLDHETRFLFEYGQCLSRAGRHEESNRVLERAARGSCDPMIHNITGKNYQAMQRYEEAERCFFRAYHTVPNRLYPLYLLARLYIESGQTARGVEMARRVVATVPKIASPATDEMKREMNEWLARQSI